MFNVKNSIPTLSVRQRTGKNPEIWPISTLLRVSPVKCISHYDPSNLSYAVSQQGTSLRIETELDIWLVYANRPDIPFSKCLWHRLGANTRKQPNAVHAIFQNYLLFCHMGPTRQQGDENEECEGEYSSCSITNYIPISWIRISVVTLLHCYFVWSVYLHDTGSWTSSISTSVLTNSQPVLKIECCII
jgi:hypothetical protein